MKRQLAGILALAMSLSMAACSSDTGSGEAPANETTTTTAAAAKDETTAKADDGDAEASQDEKQETTVTEAEENYYEKALAMLPDAELKRAYQEVKVRVYDSELPELAIQLFEEKYGGTVTDCGSLSDKGSYKRDLQGLGDNDFRKPDLYVSNAVNKDFPELAAGGYIVPTDDYIDLDSDMWSFAKDNKDYMELFNFGGKRFVAVTDVSAEGYVCYYNKQTIEKYGFDDPWELYEAGKWNWDAMKSMLSEFVDEEDLRYGIGGKWAYPRALGESTGVPMVGLSDGYLVNNFSDQTFLSALDFGRELINSGFLYSRRDEYDYYEYTPELLGDGDLLFYIYWISELNSAPEKWQVSPEDIGIVPVPSPAGSVPYQYANVSGFALLSNSENPQGRDLFAQCLALAYSDPAYIAEKEQNQKEWYENSGLSDQIISQLDEIYELAKQYPVIDYGYGISSMDKITYYTETTPFFDAFTGMSVDSKYYDNTISTAVEETNNKIKTYIETLG